MVSSHILGFPRIGPKRELKRLLESYWDGKIDAKALEDGARALRRDIWKAQSDAGLDFVTVGDFSLYDQVLDCTQLFQATPPRFRDIDNDLVRYFAMARGSTKGIACEMTKWFDTNYHYIVPELDENTQFELDTKASLFGQIREALDQGHKAKVALLGPVTYLWLSRRTDAGSRLALLDRLLHAYRALIEKIAQQDIEWLQIDEPVLGLELPEEWLNAVKHSMDTLAGRGLRIMIASYFSPQKDNLDTTLSLPIDGIHLDLARGAQDLEQLPQSLPKDRVFSAGIIDGRSVWRTDLCDASQRLRALHDHLGDNLWIAPSCSLLHVPVDADNEHKMDPQIRSWLSFAQQKLEETTLLARSLQAPSDPQVRQALEASETLYRERTTAPSVLRPAVRNRVKAIQEDDSQRIPYTERANLQREKHKLPSLPTTTIGSYPQTPEIRSCRAQWRAGKVSDKEYETRMQEEISVVIREQEELGLDVLVHGEPERNDMVEYFCDFLEGMTSTAFGWVQSYGSRCVKPPLIYGDIERAEPMTLRWAKYASSQTDKPVKGMLTGPITMLCWSLGRDDISREDTAVQLALALRDEVCELADIGTDIIQIDEPALREGAPVRTSEWPAYFEWATRAFRLSSSGVNPEIQIHSHMCYSDFNAIMPQIAALDADVVSIETSRSDMQLLSAFADFKYPNEIGPGVYDIHSPRVPSVEEFVEKIEGALGQLQTGQVWINPDCGLKTRRWDEVRAALANMVKATQRVRSQLPS